MMIRHALIAGCFIVTALPVATVYGGPWSPDPNQWDPNGLWPLDWQELREQYLARGPEVTPWLKAASLPSPDNAALLYYQAFLLRPEQDDATSLGFRNALSGEEPDGKVRAYLRGCRETIRLAEMAGQMPQCTWGLWHPDGSDFTVPVLGEVRQLTFILAVDARAQAFDGYAQAALARCLTMRQLARHVGDDTILAFFISVAIDNLARHTAQYVLGVTAPDVNTLQWLRGQLAAVEGMPRSAAKVLQTDYEFVLDAIANDAAYLQLIKEAIANEMNGGTGGNDSLNLTDEEVLARARQPYGAYLSEVFRVVDASMPYEERYWALENLTVDLIARHGQDPAAGAVILWAGAHSRRVPEAFGLLVRDRAGYNALKTAVEIYHAAAMTGELPESLPPNVPKDPFSGQDFEYEIADDGFILRCQARDLNASRKLYIPNEPAQVLEDDIPEYKFTVRMEGVTP